MTLQDYRNRYAQYKLDPDLQAAHAAFPWIVTPDDHEVENNYAGAISEQNDPRDAFLAAAPPPTRRTTSTCRCAAVPCRAGRRCSCIASSRTESSRRSSSWTRGSTAAISRAATA